MHTEDAQYEEGQYEYMRLGYGRQLFGKIFKRHGMDLLIIILLLVLDLALDSIMPVHRRQFMERDPSLSHPYTDDVVPEYAVFIISVFLPWLIILGAQLFLRWREDESVFSSDLMRGQLALFESVILATALASFLANFTGVMRPNFYAFCDYKGFRTNKTHYIETTSALSTGHWGHCLDIAKEAEARRSYPCSYAATSFAGLGFLARFIKGASDMHQRHKLWKAVIVSFIVFCASVVASTRVKANWSTPGDATAGAMIGALSAVFCYSINYTKESNRKVQKQPDNYIPNPSRTSGSDASNNDRLFDRLDASM